MNTLPRLFACYNPKGHDFAVPLPVIPWANCGMGDLDPKKDQSLRLPTKFADGTWAMFDREDPEKLKRARAVWWESIALYTGPGVNRIAYDPFSWDPAELRTAGWWLRMKRWVGFDHAVEHMRTRRALVPYLNDYAAWATDVYHPPGYDWAGYSEWAGLKLGAHVRVCTENNRIPVALLRIGGNIDLQARVMQSSDKRFRWGLWEDPRAWEDAAMHAQWVRSFVALVTPKETT